MTRHHSSSQLCAVARYLQLPNLASKNVGILSLFQTSIYTSFLSVGENVSPIQASAARPPKSHASTSRVIGTKVSSSRSMPAYVSTYRRNTSTLTYNAVPFQQTVCDIDAETGTASLIQTNTIHAILIGKGWQTHIEGGKPAGAYISKGFTKFAFKVSTCEYAYFPCA